MLPLHEISDELRELLIDHMTLHIKPQDVNFVDTLHCSKNCDIS